MVDLSVCTYHRMEDGGYVLYNIYIITSRERKKRATFRRILYTYTYIYKYILYIIIYLRIIIYLKKVMRVQICAFLAVTVNTAKTAKNRPRGHF